jgi:hypothetical protein
MKKYSSSSGLFVVIFLSILFTNASAQNWQPTNVPFGVYQHSQVGIWGLIGAEGYDVRSISGRTPIRFSMSKPSPVSLSIYDVQGRLVESLWN